jgi:hypothetical protein
VNPVQHDRLTTDQHVGYPCGELVRIFECCTVDDRSRVEYGHVCDEAFQYAASVGQAQPFRWGLRHLLDRRFK